MDLEGMQELQEVDLRRDAALRQLQAVVDQISDPPWLQPLEEEIGHQADAVIEAARELRESEARVQTAERRIEAADERLYSGTVTDHRTLEELQRDLYAQRQALIPLQDAETRARAAVDDAKQAERWLQQMRSNAVDTWNQRQGELKQQRDVAQQSVDAVATEVNAIRDRLLVDDLDLYDQYRLRHPRVVASVSGGVCGECRLSLPTMVITRARRGDRPIECPACGCLVRVA